MIYIWTDIKEKLPDKRGNYLVTIKDTDIEPLYYTVIDHYNGDGTWTNHNNKKINKIVAWGPLPDPAYI